MLPLATYLVIGTLWAWFCLGVQAHSREHPAPWWGTLANLVLWAVSVPWALARKHTRQEALSYLKSL